MKIKRFAALCAWTLALVLLLCACSGKTPGAVPAETNPTAIPPATNAQPAENDRPEAAPIADLYEKTDIDHVFRLNTVSTDGYSVQDSYLRDGYVMLMMHDFSEQGYENEIGIQHILNSGKIVLFPLQKPDAAVSLDMDRFEARYILLAGGTVLEISWEGGYTLYDSGLKEIYKESAACGTFLGASEQGDIWFLAEDASFVLYRDGKQLQTDPVEGMMHGTYLGTSGGKAYFTMYNRYYGWAYSAVDLQSGAYEEGRLLSDAYEAHNGLLCYPSEDKWYLAELADPFTVTALPKLYSNESAWDMDDRYLIGSSFEYDAAGETFRRDYHIYDLHSGSLCDEISSDAFSGCEFFIQDFEQDVILFEVHDETMATRGLYLWDLSELAAPEPAEACETIDYHVDGNRVEELIRQIYEQYGVTVYYDGEHLKEYSTGYELLECSDTDRIGYALVRLQECMAEYPEGFFEEIKGESIRNVVFCLCDGHERVFEDTIADAAATVDTIGDTLRMSIDVHCWQELRRIFLHENTHMMETRLEEEMPKVSSRHYVEYWYTEMNRPDCPPIQHYIWEQNEETMKGVYDVDPENACYIDWYSKCTISEDHARTMEHGIYSGSAHYFAAPYIDRKSRFLNAMIREAFPCVRNSGEAFWEQRTGIVDLRQEFPDFTDR